MHQFVYWYSYFDAIFTKKIPTANSPLTEMIPSSAAQWPVNACVLPQLCSCFAELQSFILYEKNWSESICTIQELNQIQADVTNVLLLLEIQKLYIIQFWHISKRRVEASVAHLYSLLQCFVGAIIPYDNMTLFECKAANKLCVKIINLQNLFKSLMLKINTICAYFSDIFFDEEDLILRNFFQNLVIYMKLMPKIKKTIMFHVSDLLKYIIIVNTIEVSVMNVTNQKKIKLNASNVRKAFENPKRQLIRNKSISSFIKNSKWLIKRRRKNVSCLNRQLNLQQNEHFEKTKKLLRFIFPTWIRRHSIKHRKQSIPKLLIQSVIIKGKSNSQFKRNYSPKEERKKIRNKSVTKTRLLLKSASIAESTQSPVKQSNHRSPLKSSLIQNAVEDEDQQCNLGQAAQSSTFIKQSKFNMKKQEQKQMYSLAKMQYVQSTQQRKNMDFLMKDYIMLKQIQQIMDS